MKGPDLDGGVIERVVRRYRRRCWWADAEDMRQEAAVAGLLAMRSWDPRVGVPWRAYLRRAVSRWLSGYLWRQSSPVSGTRGEEARGLHRAPLSDALVDRQPRPDEALVEAEWVQAVQARLALVAVKHGLDLGLRAMLSGDPEEWARREGVPRAVVQSEVRKVRSSLAGDAALLRLFAAAS